MRKLGRGSGSRWSRLGAVALTAGLFLSVLPQTVAYAAVNLAPQATVTVSSQNTATSQTGAKAIDGVAQGYPADYTKEWATVGGKAGSWITLTWAKPVYVTQVKLYDRPNTSDQVTAGTLAFSDGSSTSTVPVGALTNTGAATSVSFDERMVTSVTFRIDQVSSGTYNAGLAEIEVFGTTGLVVNQVPTANAGKAFSATVNTLVKLDGSGSSDPDGSIASWTWTVDAKPAASTVVLTDATKSAPSFTPTVTGTYTFGLVVTDNSGAASAKSTVTVTVTAPVPNQPPTANAGSDLAATVNTVVTLDGSGSKDSDGTIALHQWTVKSAPAAVTLSSATVAKPTFTPTVAGAYVFTLVVTDDKGLASASDEVTVTASTTPVVPSNIAMKSTVTASSQNATTGQTALKAVDGVAQGYPADYAKEWATAGGKAASWLQLTWPTAVSLNKIVLYDRPNTSDQVTGGTLTFSDGSSVAVGTLTNAGTTAGTAAGVPVTFAPKNVTWVKFTVGSVSATTFNVGLAEIEAWGYAAGSGNWPPTADAGPDQSVVSGTAGVKLDGSKSSDAEGTKLTYAWVQTGGTAVTLSSATAASPTFTAPAVTAPVSLTFELTVKDAAGQAATDTVVVSVNPPASITAADSAMAGVFTINYDTTYAGRTATLQVQTIATTQTTENPTATWKALGTVVLDANGDGKVTVADPYEVTHNYRAVVTISGVDNATNVITYSAPRTTRNTGLATLYLDTNESVAVTDRETDHEGTAQLVAGSGAPECTPVGRSLMKMSGRGNSTWAEVPTNKKPYKFNTDKKTSFCGIPAGKKWAVIANFEDVSLMRNMSAYWIGAKLDGLAWTPKYYPVDLYLNGSFRGQYLLIERITISTTRVNIDELKIDPTKPTAQDSFPAISGGYLMEWNHGQPDDTGQVVQPDIFVNNRGGMYLKEPDPTKGEMTTAQKAYIDKWMDDVDTLLFDNSKWLDPVNGWRKYIDESAAIDFWIAAEMTKGYGLNYRSSSWMYKARDVVNADGSVTVGKLYEGPLWDFDNSQGNADFGGGQASTSGWWMRDPNGAPRQAAVTWMNRLFEDPTFKAKASARWKSKSTTMGTERDDYLASLQSQIKASADIDHALWGVSDFTSDANSLRSWLRTRKAWLDAHIDDPLLGR